MLALALTFAWLPACGAKTGLAVRAASPPADSGTPTDSGTARDAGLGWRDAGIPAGRDAGPSPTSSVDGTWVGPLPLGGGFSRMFTFVLHARASGEVLGYVAGGTAFRTITSGRLDGGMLELDLSLVDAHMSRTIHISGFVGDGVIDARTPDDAFTLSLVAAPLTESRYRIRARGPRPVPGDLELAIVTNGAGELVSGGFVDSVSCDIAACGAGVTMLEVRPVHEGPTTYVVGFEAGGGCNNGTLTFTGVLSPVWLYEGMVDEIRCDGTVVATPIGVRISTRSRTDHALAVLRSLGAIADALEAGAPLPDGLPVSDAYLHDGTTRDGLVAAMTAQLASAGEMRVEMGSFHSLVTEHPTDVDPMLAAPFQIQFRDRRTAGPGRVLQDTTTDVDASLRFFGLEGASWLVIGNGRAL